MEQVEGGSRSRKSRGDGSPSAHKHDSKKSTSGGPLSGNTLVGIQDELAKFSTFFDTKDFSGTKLLALDEAAFIQSPVAPAPATYNKLVAHNTQVKVTVAAKAGASLTVEESNQDGTTALDATFSLTNTTSAYISANTMLELAFDWEGTGYIENIMRIV